MDFFGTAIQTLILLRAVDLIALQYVICYGGVLTAKLIQWKNIDPNPGPNEI